MATALPTSLMPTLPSSIDRSKECFYMANIDYPRYSSLTPEMAVEMLTKAMNLLSQINFSYLFINKPADGQVYLIFLQSNVEELPSDGFQYLESEISYKTTLPDGRELLCAERRHGFADGDQVTSKIRRRYRLSMGNENLQLLHYVKLEEHMRQILNPTMMMRTPVRKHPLTPIQSNVSPYIRGPQQPPIQAHHIHTQPAMRPSNPTMIPSAASSSPYVQFQSRVTPMGAGHRGGNPSVLQSAKRRGKSTKIAATAEDMEEPSGDELDNIKLREVALARYRRNHEYIEEIFSPFSTSSIKPHPSPYESKNAEELKAKLASEKINLIARI